MKNQIILIAVTILGFVLVSNAQIKQISSGDFYAANNKAYQIMSERPRRIVTKTEDFENGAIVISTTKTEERIASDKWRFATIEKKSNVANTSETIRIGSKIYRRENNGQWAVSELSSGNGTGAGFTANANCMQYTEEETFIDGVSARKLNNLEISKNEKGLTFDSFNIWYDAQGFFLRSERIKGLLEPRIEVSRSVATFEYDPKDLKIEAPIK